MMDKTVKFHKILMRRKAGTPYKNHRLPNGYSFVMFKKGDEKAWVDIENSVQEFKTKKEAMSYFRERYLPYVDELERRCIFIQEPNGSKIATFTIWWEYIGQRRYPWVSWVGVKPDYQGKGLGKALVCRGMKLLIDIEGDTETYLKTQTWSYKAVNLYIDQGFHIVKEKLDCNWDSEDYDKMISVLKKYLR